MKRGTPNHPKTYALANALGVEVWAAAGLLECLWHFTARYSPRGDIGRWPDARIAADVGWKGDPASLVSLLTRCGWLDPHPLYRVVVHDWHDHADNSVKKHLKRHKVGFLSRVRKVSRHSPDMSGHVRPLSDPAVPLPLPEPLPSPEPIAWPSSDRPSEPPPTSATPDQARTRALGHLGPPGKANPFVTGKRDELELEALQLCRAIGEERALNGSQETQDGAEIFANAAHYEGAMRQKVNPAGLTDDRLLNTLIDLRATLREEQAKKAQRA